jgi:hypothetical protein
MRNATAREHLLAHELVLRAAGTDQSPERLAEAALQVLGRLCVHLDGLIGPVGFDTLLRRGVYLAREEAPVLQGLGTGPLLTKRPLEELETYLRGQTPAAVDRGLLSVLAEFIWVLAALVSEPLTLRLIRDAWPEVMPHGADRDSEEHDA